MAVDGSTPSTEPCGKTVGNLRRDFAVAAADVEHALRTVEAEAGEVFVRQPLLQGGLLVVLSGVPLGHRASPQRCSTLCTARRGCCPSQSRSDASCTPSADADPERFADDQQHCGGAKLSLQIPRRQVRDVIGRDRHVVMIAAEHQRTGHRNGKQDRAGAREPCPQQNGRDDGAATMTMLMNAFSAVVI